MKKDEIKKILIEEIRAGRYPTNVRLPSEYELADRLGVNRITLNKAVGELVADGWLRRGTSTRDGTYIQDRSLAAHGTIGIMVPRGDSYIDGILHGIIDSASQNLWLPLLQIPVKEEFRQSEQFLRANHAEGILAATFGDFTLNGPGVLIDSLNRDNPNISDIAADMLTGSREMAQLLLKAGHREIVFILSSSFPFMRNPRCAGFYEAFREAGISNPEQRFFYLGEYSVEQLVRRILKRFPQTTALVCHSDYETLKVRDAMRKLHPEKADRITYAGFGNLDTIQKVFRFLTFDQHPYEIGQRAMELFLDWKYQGVVRHELIPGTILNRDCIQAPCSN